MNHRDKLISSHAKKVCESIAKKVISALKKIEATLSGDDSCLDNVWEEICVQAQLDESFYWEFYLLTIEQFIRAELFEVDILDKQFIWIETDSGLDWSWENEAVADIPFNEDDIVYHILYKFVIAVANDWSNHNIEKYREYYYS